MRSPLIHLAAGLVLLALALRAPEPAAAQLRLGGDLTAEYRHAGPDAHPLLNGTPSAGHRFYTPALYLFGTADLADRWWITLGVQADHYGNTDLNPVLASLWTVTWQPRDAPLLLVRAGRFASPFGLESSRPLPSDNPFALRPLLYTWHLRIDPEVGSFRAAPAYDGLAGQPVLHGRMHVQGGAATVVVGASEWLDATAAVVTGAASASPEAATAHPGVVGRVTVRPWIWGRLGMSAAYGPHARPSTANDLFSRAELGRYTQLALAGDASVSYAHYTVAAQLTHSHWRTFWLDRTPSPDAPAGRRSSRGFLLVDPDRQLRLSHLLVETVVDLPFLAGAHVGLRYERVRFADLDGSTAAEPWGADHDRLEGVAGYRLNRNLRAKIAVATATNAGDDLRDDVLVLQLNARF